MTVFQNLIFSFSFTRPFYPLSLGSRFTKFNSTISPTQINIEDTPLFWYGGTQCYFCSVNVKHFMSLV